MGKSKNAGSSNPMFGHKHTEESRKKMSHSHVGKKKGPMSEDTKKKLSAARKGLAAGSRNYFWKGGTKINHGYIKVHQPDHPQADKAGYVYEHRLVMEKKLGRYLLPGERPHHINRDKQDNRPENLELFKNNGDHMLSAHIDRDPTTGRFIGKKRAGHLLDGREWRERPGVKG